MACHASKSAHPSAAPDGDDIRQPLTQDVVATLVANHREFLEFLMRRVADRTLAEDILQEAFVRGLDRIETLRDDESVVAWFYRSLRNAVIDSYRRQGAAARRLENLAHKMEQSPEPEADLQQSVCQCVARLADTLKPEYAAALKRIEVDGISVQAFAEESGVTASNAAVRVFRARQALRKQVTAACGTCAEHGCLDCHCGA